MQSIFRYPGGKSRSSIQSRILSCAPPEFAEYREPFVGGGGVYWAVSPYTPRWINDANGDLVSVYLALRDRPDEFIAACRSIPMPTPNEEQKESATGKLHTRRLQALADQLLTDPDADRALRFFFLNRTIHSTCSAFAEKGKGHICVCAENEWRMAFSSRMEQAAEHLRGTHVTCGDFEPLFLKPGENVWIYADPPYMVDTEAASNRKLYRHGFSLDDHRRLARTVRACGHSVCLSYDDHPLVRQLYDGLWFHEESWAYSGSSLTRKKVGQELLITNYPLQASMKSVGQIDFAEAG